MSHENNNDKIFDRLVDGELSLAERQELLASLDDRHDGWRQCALAFLEAQAWDHHFKQMAVEPIDKSPALAASSEKSTTSTKPRQWFAIAAGLFIVFALGSMINTTRGPNEEDVGVAATDPSVIERQEMPLRDEFPSADSRDAVTLVVRDTSGKHQRLQLPLMEVESFDKQFGAALPDDLRAQFRDRGFDVQRRRRFAPMFFEQNKQLVPMVVPVDDTYVVPVSRPVF